MPNHQQLVDSKPSTSEDEISAELDEPPDDHIEFSRALSFTKSLVSKQHAVSAHLTHNGNASLLTRGLLTSPNLTPSSDVEAPCLTSDGGVTSPARTNSPSPPLQTSDPCGVAATLTHDVAPSDANPTQKHPALDSINHMTKISPATDVEVGLGRKRCIRFACGRQAAAHQEESYVGKAPPTNGGVFKVENSSKRPCMLKFVCPIKPLSGSSGKQQPSKDVATENRADHSSSSIKRPPSSPHAQSGRHRDSDLHVEWQRPNANCAETSQTFNPQDLEGSEATRFHEFAGPYSGEDEWVHEQTAHRKKITVNDTLEKENVIRKLGEEAEEEAMEEENAEKEEPYSGLAESDDRLSSDDEVSDGGNESDNEEGFAESDDESETGSDYQFWTPGLTTAATSADHLEHFRPTALRTPSNSSIESMIHVKRVKDVSDYAARRIRRSSQTQSLRMRPGTPDLPDSTDFVCGTLDEDRPLEAAYLSCLEERRRSKHPVIPQDIDPSFPTSDFEDDEDARDDAGKGASTGDEPQLVTGQPDDSDEEHMLPQRTPLSRRNTKSPMPSPKRMRSPPPQKRNLLRRCPVPRATSSPSYEQGSSSSSSGSTGQPRPLTRNSPAVVEALTNPQKAAVHRLPRRSTVTHTASLPRTPNPFWSPSGQWSHLALAAGAPQNKTADMRSRGPVDIVTGLEKKRQRRKEKFWRQHYRGGGKDKERRCQPGKGAERMRELGLEMAGKNKGQLPYVQLMLSI
ncbi:MAG: hypothetical protein Q9216_000628 [Gyalolechia sp. 2 TL-2023]